MRLTRPTSTLVLAGALALGLAGALLRAQSDELTARRAELRTQFAADQQAAGLAGTSNRGKLFSQFPTPEISLTPVSVQPGGSTTVSVKGKFSDKTLFVAGGPAITLSNVSVAPNAMKATITVGPGLRPQWARLYAFAPVSGAETWAPAVFIGTPQTYSLTAKNGWTITLKPAAKQFTLSEQEARVGYTAEYRKPGATAPFETTSGTLKIEVNDSSSTQYAFMMQSGSLGSAAEEIQTISERMGELMKAGKFGSKELEDLNRKLEAAQERMMKEVEPQMADPAAAQKKRDAFGCESIFLAVTGASAKGSVQCGSQVGSLELTGSVLP